MSFPPFLAMMPTYGGALAAVRSLGQRGIPVTVAGDGLLAPARWSRYATRWERCPKASEPDRLLDWLLAFGRRRPRHVLYATSDDLAYFFAVHARELESSFYLYQPPLDTIVRVLDKKRLLGACESVGLEVLPAWFPAGPSDVQGLVGESDFPLLIKARTQVRRIHQNKGVVVERPRDLLPAYHRFLADHRYRPGLEPHFGDVTQPMIQRYLPEGADRVYSLTGFVDRSGAHRASRAAFKVFSRTRPVGLGLCFEAAPVDGRLLEAVLRLCRKVGHYGVFEVEFVQDGERSMVIDLNPRFYGQMGFDSARGLPLALLAYYGAIGDRASLEACVAEATQPPPQGATIYTHRFVFELLLAAQRATRSISPAEHLRWRQWYARHRDGAADASADAHDWAPGFVHAAAELAPGLRLLRRTLALSKT
ncbi:MAG: carbamoyl-phosphate synthase [Myxococcales bacterium]|nr:carbamoyl-phosphate synthase [Myxococcales bacterium]